MLDIAADSPRTPAWKRTLDFFWEHVFPELVFAILIVIAVALARMLGLSPEAQDLVGLFGLLALGAEALIRWRLVAMLQPLGSLDKHVQDYGLAIADHVKLSDLARAYVNARACELAQMQRHLAEQSRYELPVGEVFRELGVIVELATGLCDEIRALASKDLIDYVRNPEAKQYFEINKTAAKKILIRRLFILNEEDYGNSHIRNLVRSQEAELRATGLTLSQGGNVKWLYKPSSLADAKKHANSVDPGYSDDWILFGTALLVRHDVPGTGYATVSFDKQDIDRVADKFNGLWQKALSPEALPEEEGEARPKREGPGIETQPKLVQVVSPAGKIA